jgi:hypothetical protein
MILNKSSNVLVKNDNFTSKQFTMQADKIFRIVLDGIYSDTYGSIVREITSNAIDANTEAGSTSPVIVSFIDADELSGVGYQLIIRDSGVGISPNRMFDIFCNLGQSTKNNDNNSIGGYGIGSKSPFKYTDTYTVKTIFSGIEYMYIMVINENDIPECNLIYETETTAESGTEIIIPIKTKNDYEDFKIACQDQLAWFDNIEFQNVNVLRPKILYEDEHVIISDSNNDCIVGRIPYKLKQSSKRGITYKFAIGELQPTASRESIDTSKIIDGKTYNEIWAEKARLASDSVLKYIESKSGNTDVIEYVYLVFKYLSGTELQNALDKHKSLTYNFIKIFIGSRWNKRITEKSASIIHSISDIVLFKQNFYYYDDDNITERDIKREIGEYTGRSISYIKKGDYPQEIEDLLINKYNFQPLSSIVTHEKIERASRTVDKTTVKFTLLKDRDACTRSVSGFINEFLGKEKPVVFLNKDSKFPYSSYSEYNHLCVFIRLEPSQLNKIGVHESLIHVDNQDAIYEYLIKYSKKFFKEFVSDNVVPKQHYFHKKLYIYNILNHFDLSSYHSRSFLRNFVKSKYSCLDEKYKVLKREFAKNPEYLKEIKKLSIAKKAYQRLYVDKKLIPND